MNENCIFCKLASGEIETATLYEDDAFRVILDASPASKGHALIIPKQHFENLYDLDEETARNIMPLAKKMVLMMTHILGCDGYNIIQNNGKAAGQTVFHFHMHLIPRYSGDQVGIGWKMEKLSEKEKSALVRAAAEYTGPFEGDMNK